MQDVVIMKHIIYKITNNLNGRYYIGRHSTLNVNDGYMGSGKGIINAVKKYGKDNFTKEIIAEAFTASDLWELENQIVNVDVVKDPLSYNMAYGGKSYLDGLKKYNYTSFIQHQKTAGLKGGIASYSKKNKEQRQLWHSLGGKTTAQKHMVTKDHPFYTGEAASLGGKAVKGMVELWSPTAKATNKNQINYVAGECKKARIGSEKYNMLLEQGWLPVNIHKQKMHTY